LISSDTRDVHYQKDVRAGTGIGYLQLKVVTQLLGKYLIVMFGG
jgi:hypothetical protein